MLWGSEACWYNFSHSYNQILDRKQLSGGRDYFGFRSKRVDAIVDPTPNQGDSKSTVTLPEVTLVVSNTQDTFSHTALLQ